MYLVCKLQRKAIFCSFPASSFTKTLQRPGKKLPGPFAWELTNPLNLAWEPQGSVCLGVPTLSRGEEAAATPRGLITRPRPGLPSSPSQAPERGSRDRRMRTTTLLGAAREAGAGAVPTRGPGSGAVHLLDVFPHLGTVIADHQQLQGMVHETVLQDRERPRSGTGALRPGIPPGASDLPFAFWLSFRGTLS